jgi:hypothetical protein
VFEILADNTKCKPVEGGLAGLGFSSTKHDNFVVRVRSDKSRRNYNVKIG